jgi:hypothetical protein
MHNNRLYEQAQYHMQRANLLENELSEEKAVNNELIDIIEALCNELGFTFEELLEGSYETSEEQREKREKSDDPTRTRAGRSEMNKEDARKARAKAMAEKMKKKKK